MTFWEGKTALVTGAMGFLGSHLLPLLSNAGAKVIVVHRGMADLRDPRQTKHLFDRAGRVDVLFHLAADVGGIGYNQANAARLLHDNAMMGLNVLSAANAGKMVVMGTTCSYPRDCPVPFREQDLFSGYPEGTNAPYGIAKRLLLVYLEALGGDWVYAIPTNLYGERDAFDDGRSHVIPALIKRFSRAVEDEAQEVTVWGTGDATRDFLYAGDCARGLMLLAEHGSGPVNLGSNRETSIRELVWEIGRAIGYEGRVRWDHTKPDGQPRRLLDTAKAKSFGFEPEISLEKGLRRTVEWYRHRS